jgi:3-oxoadipate enol-lactonase
MPVMMTHDTSIDFDVYGDGPPLLLIGGLGFGRWAWFKQVPELSRRFRTITFDIRGEHDLAHGVADLTAEVVALLDYLGVEKTHVLGTSLGGFVAQELALERPDLVDLLVLVCTSYGGAGPDTMSPQALGRMLGWGSSSSENAVLKSLETATSDAYRAERPEEFDLIMRWRLADSPSLSDYYQQVMAGARFNASREVGDIASPTLVIHGAEDRYVPVANAVALAEAIPEARLRVIEDAGHLVFIEKAEEVNEEIVSFLKPRKPRERRRRQTPPPRQRTKELIQRTKELNKGLISSLKPQRRHKDQEPSAKQEKRSPQKIGGTRKTRADQEPSKTAEKRPALGKLKGWFRWPARITGAWTKKLRDRLSR